MYGLLSVVPWSCLSCTIFLCVYILLIVLLYFQTNSLCMCSTFQISTQSKLLHNPWFQFAFWRPQHEAAISPNCSKDRRLSCWCGDTCTSILGTSHWPCAGGCLPLKMFYVHLLCITPSLPLASLESVCESFFGFFSCCSCFVMFCCICFLEYPCLKISPFCFPMWLIIGLSVGS